MEKFKTRFEQVPLEIVKKIVEKENQEMKATQQLQKPRPLRGSALGRKQRHKDERLKV
jgi:hypothetical protein